jgi:hypothetical protein
LVPEVDAFVVEVEAFVGVELDALVVDGLAAVLLPLVAPLPLLDAINALIF